MPNYEYACTKCGEHFEIYQSFTDDPLKRHTGCGGKLNKVYGAVGIVLKGSGFYRNEHGAGARSKKAASSESSKSEKSTTSSETSTPASTPASTETKSDAPAKTPNKTPDKKKAEKKSA